MQLPTFRYHPDPLSTGSVKVGNAVCDCCGKARGFQYAASFYCLQSPRPILCPWCIATGEAAEKYDGQFSDDGPLEEDEIASEIVDEVCKRTPGYISWQQDVWMAHCEDACEFHGDAEPTELSQLGGEELEDHLLREGLQQQDWDWLVSTYQKGGDAAVYKFVCRHCRKPIFTVDFS